MTGRVARASRFRRASSCLGISRLYLGHVSPPASGAREASRRSEQRGRSPTSRLISADLRGVSRRRAARASGSHCRAARASAQPRRGTLAALRLDGREKRRSARGTKPCCARAASRPGGRGGGAACLCTRAPFRTRASRALRRSRAACGRRSSQASPGLCWRRDPAASKPGRVAWRRRV